MAPQPNSCQMPDATYTLAMNKPEYPTHSQYRAALEVSSSQHVWIEGITLRDAGGDGLNIRPEPGPTHLQYPQYCIDVTAMNVTCDNNNRNAMSVTGVDGLKVQGCAFINSIGTAPQAGVDIEPNDPGTFPEQWIVNVTFVNARLSGNHNNGLDVSLWGMRGLTTPVTISFDRVMIFDNGGFAGVVIDGAGTANPGGNVTMSKSLIYTDQNSACVRVEHKSESGMAVEFDDAVYWDEPSITSKFSPITVSPVFSSTNLEDPVSTLR